MTRPRRLNSIQSSLPATSGQPGGSLCASCRCSACWVCRPGGPLWSDVNTLATLLGSNTTTFFQGPLSRLVIAINTNCSRVVMEDLYRSMVRTTHTRLNHPVLRSEMNPASTGRDLQHVEIPGSDILYSSRQPPVLDGAHRPTPLRADIPARATIVMPVPPAAGASAWSPRGRVPMVVAPKTYSVCQSLP